MWLRSSSLLQLINNTNVHIYIYIDILLCCPQTDFCTLAHTAQQDVRGLAADLLVDFTAAGPCYLLTSVCGQMCGWRTYTSATSQAGSSGRGQAGSSSYPQYRLVLQGLLVRRYSGPLRVVAGGGAMCAKASPGLVGGGDGGSTNRHALTSNMGSSLCCHSRPPAVSPGLAPLRISFLLVSNWTTAYGATCTWCGSLFSRLATSL